MIYAQNNVEIGAANWSAPILLQWSGWKIDVMVNLGENEGEDFGACYFQVSENEQQSFSGAEAVDTSMLLRPGFSSRVFVRPFTAVRFQAFGPIPALLDYVIYG